MPPEAASSAGLMRTWGIFETLQGRGRAGLIAGRCDIFFVQPPLLSLHTRLLPFVHEGQAKRTALMRQASQQSHLPELVVFLAEVLIHHPHHKGASTVLRHCHHDDAFVRRPRSSKHGAISSSVDCLHSLGQAGKTSALLSSS